MTSLFRKKLIASGTALDARAFMDDLGVRYQMPGIPITKWFENPYAFTDHAELGARLAQLRADGMGEVREDEFILNWDDVYLLLASPEYRDKRAALRIPEETSARPRIKSQGALIDPDFTILLDGWLDLDGRPLQPAPRLTGRVLQYGDQQGLLPETVHHLLNEMARFHSTPASSRTQSFKEQHFGRIRKYATLSGCPVSDYVAKTIVLTPERLRLQMEQRGNADNKILEVIPGFEEAPAAWLPIFDRLPLQERYDIPDGPSLVRVVIDPKVKNVLAEIKAMHGRRVIGPRAEAFVRNPFGVLGADAAEVISPEQFEAARVEAGLVFKRFRAQDIRGQYGEISYVQLLIESLEATTAPDESIDLITPDELATLIGKLRRGQEDGSQCIRIKGQELEIESDTPALLTLLEQWLREWRNPVLWTAAEVFDLSHYAERVASIGVDKPVVTPVIARKNDGNDWFEGNAVIGMQVAATDGHAPRLIPIEFEEIATLQTAVAAAEASGVSTVQLPGLVTPVPVDDCKRAVADLAAAHLALKRKSFTPPSRTADEKQKQRLIIKRNLEDIDYNEQRAAALDMPADRRAVIPKSLSPSAKLKPHQEVGVAWLQHLWDASPHRCRGTVLADDMGLGKTIQLLTFIINCFEQAPELPPALIVAPVALLNNWHSEIRKFFGDKAPPVLMLYGQSLRGLMVRQDQIDDQLQALGLNRFLAKNWVAGHKIVLTTYETMRDLEFSLAAQEWSIMVCDEAQKIKTPSTLVTTAAKKQKVRFRIACTGTPVENTLADLWCLFDFVQPGLLGALNHFSRTYRKPIEAKTEAQKAKVEELRAVIRPQILYRKKAEVAKDLPVPVEDQACKTLPMSSYQLKLYEAALKTLQEKRESDPSAQLQALQAIRKICSDPHGYAEQQAQSIPISRLLNESPKMGWMAYKLKELAADEAGNHKVIIFCEFRELQLQIQRVVASFFGFAPSIVNGDTSADPILEGGRQQLITRFQEAPGFGVIILSPLAVGFGVNIQAANHVIHFTRTWNPAKEDQATARAYRIGQTRTVTVYYPGVVNPEFPSFDVRLDVLLSKKRALASDMLNGCSDLKASDFADFG